MQTPVGHGLFFAVPFLFFGETHGCDSKGLMLSPQPEASPGIDQLGQSPRVRSC